MRSVLAVAQVWTGGLKGQVQWEGTQIRNSVRKTEDLQAKRKSHLKQEHIQHQNTKLRTGVQPRSSACGKITIQDCICIAL